MVSSAATQPQEGVDLDKEEDAETIDSENENRHIPETTEEGFLTPKTREDKRFAEFVSATDVVDCCEA